MESQLEIERKLHGVEGKLFRKMFTIKWTDRVSSIELAVRTAISNVNMEIQKRRRKYTGLVLGMDNFRHVRNLSAKVDTTLQKETRTTNGHM